MLVGWFVGDGAVTEQVLRCIKIQVHEVTCTQYNVRTELEPELLLLVKP